MDAVKVIKKSGAPGAVPAVTAYVDEPLLPKVSAEDAGKAVVVNSDGELALGSVDVDTGKYLHTIQFVNEKQVYGIILINTDDATPFTTTTLTEWLFNNNHKASSTAITSVTGSAVVQTEDATYKRLIGFNVRGVYASANNVNNLYTDCWEYQVNQKIADSTMGFSSSSAARKISSINDFVTMRLN